MVDCEIIDIGSEQLQTKPEYKDRLILIKRTASEAEPETQFLKCPGCNILHPLTDYTVDSTNDIVTITEEFQCLVVSCGRKFHVTNNVLVE